jgi:hypothetical protein
MFLLNEKGNQCCPHARGPQQDYAYVEQPKVEWCVSLFESYNSRTHRYNEIFRYSNYWANTRAILDLLRGYDCECLGTYHNLNNLSPVNSSTSLQGKKEEKDAKLIMGCWIFFCELILTHTSLEVEKAKAKACELWHDDTVTKWKTNIRSFSVHLESIWKVKSIFWKNKTQILCLVKRKEHNL